MSTSIGEGGAPEHTVVVNQMNALNVYGAAREAGIDAYTVGIDDRRYEQTICLLANPEQLEEFHVVMARYRKSDSEHDKRIEEGIRKIWQ
jgi:hypothetical protein